MSTKTGEEELDRVRTEVKDRRLSGFTRNDALALGQAALALAQRDNLPVVIDVRRGEQVVFHAAREGTTSEHDDWVRRKINTALRHEIPSYEFALRQRVSGRQPDWLDPLMFAIAGGAVPIEVGGSIAGVITVSGIVSSPGGDHDLAMAALRVMSSAGAADDRRN